MQKNIRQFRMKKFYFIFFLFCSSLLFSQKSVVKVKVINLENRIGNISIGLFNNPDGFPKKEFGKIGISIPIKKFFVEHTFSNLEKGNYALAIYHDENSNEKLDRSIFGWPTEDYVFSNYAEGNFGPPSFNDASFELKDSLEIVLEFK